MKRTKLDLLIERCSEGAPRKSCELCCCDMDQCFKFLSEEKEKYEEEKRMKI